MEFLKLAFANVDTVVNIAGISFSRVIVLAARECYVRRLILVHTTGIYSKYKRAGEEYRQIDDFVYRICKECGIILTILRSTMIYGNSSDMNIIKFIRMVDRFPLMPVVNGARFGLQPVHFSDLGTAYYQVLMNEATTGNRDFILSGGEPIDLRDMLTEIGRQLEKKTRFINIPFFIAYGGAWLIYALTLSKIDYREKYSVCVSREHFHIKKPPRHLGILQCRLQKVLSKK